MWKNTMSWIKEHTLNWFQLLVLKIIKTGHMPKHVAFIMDGNRRYAKKQEIPTTEGHKKGSDKLAEIISWCKQLGITDVTLYAFSIENFKRPKIEVDGLMEIIKYRLQQLLEEKDKLREQGICIRVIGNLSLLPEDVRQLCAEAMIITKNNNKATLNLAFAYTSRDEITHAIKDILRGVKRTDILPEDINEDLISHCLYTYKSPNPDLLIRTSGETRLSDFLLWQISNSCLYFTDVLWPEVSVWNLLKAIFYYQRCYSDLQKVAKVQNSNPVVHNDRVSMYINKLHHEREVIIEKII
ncbi:dehydrodolichyl diphosphate synthase complex subunit DHDDS-like [Nylanderia fulva]|uniref:dehydrodolichyl diphosphate synthase complex subunit DHDDS-like n=1 Tax=Nylanderia fulva TaxID=613905 RepID=UPI0010FB5A4A|nr:dehydrodolichyl diphosphate synthase complex subunit DHDDS-like [Nylanderia fulva]XP_029164779.1 dehydrodolichyl diphosphate synthase complex subunit DHDDS-like [Nylanderia fulva]XP_029164780.1 dehydrodolichyl diphosphate synthase complex subunit DHDDS-like [Nylanderia fulva]